MSFTGGATAARLSAGRDTGGPVVIPREPARREAHRELSRPMYHTHDPNLLQRAIDRILGWADSLLSSASSVAPGGALGLTVIVLVVVVLVAGLWWRLGTPHRTPGRHLGGAVFDDGLRSAAHHRRTAEAHAANHHWNEAVQERMRAVVRSLEERTLLEPRPGRTSDEAAVEAGRSLPGHAGRLRAAARDFDDVTYGGRDTDQDTYQRLVDLDRAMEHTRPELGTPAAAPVPGGPPV